MIGHGTIGKRAPRQKRDVNRRRLRTVISNLVMMSAHVTTHARQLVIGLGKSNVWRHIFMDFCEGYSTGRTVSSCVRLRRNGAYLLENNAVLSRTWY